MKGFDYDINKIGAYVNRAGVHHILGDDKAALIDLEEALRLDPTNVDALFNKARQ